MTSEEPVRPDPLDPQDERDPAAAGTDVATGTLPPNGDVAPPIGVREIEALLFVAERPISRREIGTLCGIDADRVDTLLGDLEVALRDRGIRLAVLGDEVRLVTAPEAGPLIGRYIGAGESRVSPAAMEALAIIAYRQPVTRGVIERIRGVDSDYVLRSLIARRLVVEQGRADSPGRPILYGTSFEFLERFGLSSLDDLPPLDAEVAARLALPDEDEDRSEGEGTGTDDEADEVSPA
jgi:segregation and condensation protein B